MKILIASNNPSKIQGTRDAIRLACPDEPALDVMVGYTPPDVPDQPMGYQETLHGAESRLMKLIERDGGINSQRVYVAVEGGVEEDFGGRLWLFQVAVVIFRGKRGEGQSARYVVPPRIAALVRDGLTHAEANRQILGSPPPSSEEGYGEGTIFYLTNGQMDRAALVEQAVATALIQGLHPELYPTAS